MNNVSYNLAK